MLAGAIPDDNKCFAILHPHNLVSMNPHFSISPHAKGVFQPPLEGSCIFVLHFVADIMPRVFFIPSQHLRLSLLEIREDREKNIYWALFCHQQYLLIVNLGNILDKILMDTSRGCIAATVIPIVISNCKLPWCSKALDKSCTFQGYGTAYTKVHNWKQD